jgi:iron complex outermembrane receptor protein
MPAKRRKDEWPGDRRLRRLVVGCGHHYSRELVRLLIAAAVLIAVPRMAGAQAAPASPSPSPSPSRGPSEYVEVVATRIPEPPDQVPAAIDVIPGEELESRGATDLPRALALSPGVDIAPGGDNGPASSVPEFWGLKEFDAFLLVVDGVPWGGAFNPDLATLDLGDVERIEVLRGAAPVMYGATSFVGVVHVVHRDPAAARRVVSIHGGSYGSGGGRLTARLPDWAGWASSLSLDGEKQGFRDDRTAYRRGHLLWRNRRAWGAGRVWFNLDGTLLDQDPASPHPRQGAGLSPLVPLDANHNPADAFLDHRRGALSAGFERPWGAASWTTTASLSRASQDIFRGFLSELTEADDNARGLREKVHLTDAYFDSHLTWTSRDRLRVVGGLDFLHGEGKAEGADFSYHVPLRGRPPVRATAPAPLDVTIEDRRDFGGGYTFAEWDASSRLRLEGGLRLNLTNEERGEGEEAERKDAGEEGVRHARLSGSVGVLWTAWQRGSDRVRLFTSYRNTFKPAAIDFGIEKGEEGEGILDPETSHSYEVGLKAAGFSDRLRVEVDAFLMDLDNLVIARTVNGLPALTNAGTERFKGVEGGLSWRLSGPLRGRASYSVHDARFRDFVMEFDGVPTQLAGKRLEMSAHHLASGGILYAPDRGLLASAEVGYVGGRFLNKRNTALEPGYATFGGSVGYRTARWELRLDARNLNDRRDAVAESELGDAQYYRLPARRVDLTIARRF